jgi:uncharacterized protein (TIGR03437 family)
MSKKSISILIPVALVALVPAVLFAHSGGADPGLSGAPGDSTCAACHGDGTVNTAGGKVVITFPGNGYTPGSTYAITVAITDSTAQRWGFEIAARTADNSQAGTFAPSDSFTKTLNAGGFNWETHTSAGTRAGTSGPTTFQMNWTAPANNVGTVTFYVAANAANNNGFPDAGDHIYTSSVQVTAQSATSTPVISAVVQATAFGGRAVVSAGTWIEIYGSNLSGTTRPWQLSDFTGNTAPTKLDSVGVMIDNVPAFVSYISPGQVNVQVPAISTAPGNSTVVVTGSGGVQSAAFSVPREEISPGLLAPASFTVDTVSYPVATFTDLVTFVGNTGLVPGFNFRPAKPGDTIILYAVGCGSVNPSVDPGQIAAGQTDLVRPVRVLIANQDAEIVYKGLYPGFVGLYEIYAKIPALDAGTHGIQLTVNDVPTRQILFITIGQ